MENNGLQMERLYIPFDNFTTIGGPSTFMQNLKVYLDSIGYNYNSVPGNNDSGIFFPIDFDLEIINLLKTKGAKIIQRLDGIYYPAKHGVQYIDLNANIKNIYLHYADHVIFQSEYSKKQCFGMLGIKNEQNHSLICNGVHKDNYYPDYNHTQNNFFIIITTGNFRNRDMIEPVVNALDCLQDKFLFEFHIIGPVVNDDIKKCIKRNYVVHHGHLKREEISQLLRNADIFIYSHLNPPCPNSVLEAISTGLPVVGFDSGAMSELCWFSKDLLAYVSNDVFQKYEDFKPDALAEKIEMCINNYEHYRKLALDHSHLYSFEECGAKYVEVFEKVISNVELKKNYSAKIRSFKTRGSNKMKSIVKKRTDKLRNKIIERLSVDNFKDMLVAQIQSRAGSMSADDALCFIFDIDNKLYEIEGQASVRYGNGLHTKHRHIKYHDFFIENIAESNRVLDVGCGNGALSFDIADKVKDVSVFGIDIEKDNILLAEKEYMRNNIRYIHGDALCDLPDEQFDVIVLSNVLEHIKERIEFLHLLNTRYNPDKFLIRVPMFDRDWRVPLKKEIGMDYRLDKTHYIEYFYPEFEDEINSAGLFVEGAKINWGEIWAVVRNAK